MGATFTVDLDVAGHPIRAVSVTWGLIQRSHIRQDAPSYGTDIEIPAVVELLDLVAAGAVSAEEARDALNDLAAEINERMDREYEERWDRVERARVRVPAQPQEERLDSRLVYAISTEDNPKVIKIGVATDIAKRMRSLQIGSAATLVLRWSAQGGYPLESHLHEAFRKKRMHGEWFDFRRVADPVKKISEAAQGFLRRFAAPADERSDGLAAGAPRQAVEAERGVEQAG
ncbi:GIY-YIG nuclease family protein [Streptomyces lavendulocolor]|uniref:GIY-YIG nuclease family protein n=1 Tax=Streptomyces lavendulocolor TaxID=67316 RepID=UPI003C30A42D